MVGVGSTRDVWHTTEAANDQAVNQPVEGEFNPLFFCGSIISAGNIWIILHNENEYEK